MTTQQVKDMAERAVAKLTCPACGQEGMTISWRLTPQPVGRFMLGGKRMAWSGCEAPVVRCPGCGIEAEGSPL